MTWDLGFTIFNSVALTAISFSFYLGKRTQKQDRVVEDINEIKNQMKTLNRQCSERLQFCLTQFLPKK